MPILPVKPKPTYFKLMHYIPSSGCGFWGDSSLRRLKNDVSGRGMRGGRHEITMSSHSRLGELVKYHVLEGFCCSNVSGFLPFPVKHIERLEMQKPAEFMRR